MNRLLITNEVLYGEGNAQTLHRLPRTAVEIIGCFGFVLTLTFILLIALTVTPKDSCSCGLKRFATKC